MIFLSESQHSLNLKKKILFWFAVNEKHLPNQCNIKKKYLNAWHYRECRKCLDCGSEGRWLVLVMSYSLWLGRERLSKATPVQFLGLNVFFCGHCRSKHVGLWFTWPAFEDLLWRMLLCTQAWGRSSAPESHSHWGCTVLPMQLHPCWSRSTAAGMAVQGKLWACKAKLAEEFFCQHRLLEALLLSLLA